MKIYDYLECPYEDGGRGPNTFDCWGLVRHARHEMGFRLLPLYQDVGAEDKEGLTACHDQEVRDNLAPSDACDGAIATVWRKGLCVHVGVVVYKDGRAGVLDTGKRTGPRWMTIKKFERLYNKVAYLHDRDLP